MPSILSGYEYDIFISYRHNDNLDGWVTDFVQNLEKELRSTLKDTLTIYFDKTPIMVQASACAINRSILKCNVYLSLLVS